MQEVAAKNDASYDLSRGASVTGQTTVAASTATTSLPNGRIVTTLFAGALFLSVFPLFVLERNYTTPFSEKLLVDAFKKRGTRHGEVLSPLQGAR
jgi:hypothetical protein